MAHKIPTPKTNLHQPDKSFSLLKKNELMIIFIGALLVTLAVFFVFFRSPDSKPSQGKTPDKLNEMEKKLDSLESKIEKMITQAPEKNQQGDNKDFLLLEQRTDRIESGLMLKIDALIHRMDNMEKRIKQIEKKVVSPPIKPVSKQSAKTKTPKKSPEKLTSKIVVKKLTKKTGMQKTKKQEPMFHTVKKGETLWSISQKYKTSVKKLRELNNLSKESRIYPGINILVR